VGTLRVPKPGPSLEEVQGCRVVSSESLATAREEHALRTCAHVLGVSRQEGNGEGNEGGGWSIAVSIAHSVSTTIGDKSVPECAPLVRLRATTFKCIAGAKSSRMAASSREVHALASHPDRFANDSAPPTAGSMGDLASLSAVLVIPAV